MLVREVVPGFVVVELGIDPGADRHEVGRLAAAQALAMLGGGSLGYDGTRPIVIGGTAAISITHSRTRAVAVAARTAKLGIDLVEDSDAARLQHIAGRYLSAERDVATTPSARAACFAAKEAGLKALGLGLLDGGFFDDCAVRVVSLDPPQLTAGLTLLLDRTDGGTLAIAYA